MDSLPIDELMCLLNQGALCPKGFDDVQINEIGQIMGKHTIAEFVESEAILNVLRDIGVNYAQGYAVGESILITMN
jgi:hypothetical protein